MKITLSEAAYRDLYGYLRTHETDIAHSINDFDNLKSVFREVLLSEPQQHLYDDPKKIV